LTEELAYYTARISRNVFYEQLAKLISKRGTCTRLQVGCLFVKEGRIIVTGYNSSPAGTPHCTDKGCILDETGHCIRTVHAEAGAISFAARHGIQLLDTTIYITHTPCLDCAKLLINCGVKEVYFIMSYGKDDGVKLMKQSGIKISRPDEVPVC